MSVTETRPPTTAEPEASVTAPRMVDNCSWPKRLEVEFSKTENSNTTRELFFMAFSLLYFDVSHTDPVGDRQRLYH